MTRKIIIDTDTGSDDAVAIMMCLRDPGVEVLALTTVSGNVPLEQATLNCLMSVEVAVGKENHPPVYMGADRPLYRERVHARNVHGNDGMADCDLIHPSIKPVEGVKACDAIIDLVKQYPDEIELAVIGPVTNVALAMMKDPETMKHVKCIWTMGTTGFGRGNTTPVSEFNVYADAEAYKVMMDFGVHVYVGGYDLCTSDNAWFDADTKELLDSGTKAARFAVESNEMLAKFCEAIGGERRIDLPDAVSLSPMLWSDVIEKSVDCVSYVCTENLPTYGQVIFYDGVTLAAMGPGFDGKIYGKEKPNCTVIYKVNSEKYKSRLAKLLMER
ncbi:MAG: nucleoside hydrolase [Erysipelotrichaceae bacterium]|nr:nucleoside hydrolase [Erysipelotrichaceae bacterium]